MRVVLVTTWQTDCGIAEHSAMLKEAVEAADPTIEIVPEPEALDPNRMLYNAHTRIVHLNYQAALHSRWTPEFIRMIRASGQAKVLVTYHDTGVPNSDQCKAVIDAADAAVVHEPFDDLPADKTFYWRMGVPDWVEPYVIDRSTSEHGHGGRPFLGSAGFPFPHKNYDELCRVTAAVGWGLLLVAPRATALDEERWRSLQPHLIVEREFLPRRSVIGRLTGCDATAFLYTCANTGQSGAVLQGIAARKPVVAFSHCRQFRALYEDPLGHDAIIWCQSFADVARELRAMPIQRCDPQTVALAEQDSWRRLGQRYAELYRSLVD